ncbi:MAG: DEAD/DEAH box helicase [Deltaproteobacteria bacterium]|nr:DEAD/DEAH box helicase [Deltaproteobacteria bacterium]
MSEESPLAGLAPALAEALTGRGYTTLTEVQQKALDPTLVGRDLQIASRTGSGKTLAVGFVLAESLAAPGSGTKALLIAPTRELAAQLGQELSWLYKPAGYRVTVVAGGASARNEERALAGHPQVVVGTPGRLLDHLTRGALDASLVSALVLDEADQLLDLGFRDELLAILEQLPTERRTHLVSATFSREVLGLAKRFQQNPVMLEGTRLGAAHSDIQHVVHVVRDDDIDDALVNLLLLAPDERALLFVRTRAGAKLLAERLNEAGMAALAISGELEQRERNQTLASFRRGQVRTLVATDVAARGLDVPEVTRVIHVASPQNLEGLTHRSGRTGRAGKKGTSIILVPPSGRERLRSLLSRAKIQAQWNDVPGPVEIRQAADRRLVEGLGAAPPPSDELMTLASTLLASQDPVELVAKLLDRTGHLGPTEARPVRAFGPTPRRTPDRQEPSRSQPDRRPQRPAPEKHAPSPKAKAPRLEREHLRVLPPLPPETELEVQSPVMDEVLAALELEQATMAPAPVREQAEVSPVVAEVLLAMPAAPAPAPKAKVKHEAEPRTERHAQGASEVRPDRPARTDRAPRMDREPRTEREPRTDREPRVAREPRADREPHIERAVRSERSERGPAPGRRDRPETQFVPFEINWGEAEGADARRLLAMVCRRGRIEGDLVGAIRIGRSGSIFEVRADAVPTFSRAIERPDPRNPDLLIQALGAPRVYGKKKARPAAAAPVDGGYGPPKRKSHRLRSE